MGGPCQGIRNSIPSFQQLGYETEVVCLDPPEIRYGVDDPFVIHRLGVSRGPWAYSAKLIPWFRNHLLQYHVVIIHGLWLFPSYAVTREIASLRKAEAKRLLKKWLASNDTNLNYTLCGNALATGLTTMSEANGAAANADRLAQSVHVEPAKRIETNLPRFFVMPHGMLDPWFQRDSSRRFKAIRNWFVWKLVERHTIAQADGVFFTCQQELELAKQTFRPYQPKREINVGYGVIEPSVRTPDMDAAFHATTPELNGRPYLLFLSRIHPKKGVDLLLKAYANVAFRSAKVESGSSLFAEQKATMVVPDLVVAGPIDSEYARRMISMAKELGLSDRVHFPGMLSGDAKWGAFYGCEAFVLPSHQENFGIAVAEALACSKPVLISNQVNIWREIESSGAGIVAEDTEQGTYQLLERWGAMPGLEKESIGLKARACYRQHFDILKSTQRMANALSGVTQ